MTFDFLVMKAELKILIHLYSLHLGHALTGGHIAKSTMSDFICVPDRGFQGNHAHPLSAIKMHLKCHKLKTC